MKAVNVSVCVCQFGLHFLHRHFSVSCRANVSKGQIDNVITVNLVIQCKIIISNLFQY